MLTTRFTVISPDWPRRGKILATTNPDNPLHWLRQDYILRAEQTKLAQWHFTIDDNPMFDEQFKKQFKESYPPGLFYKRFVLGEWVAAEGAIFDMWDETRHIIDIFPAPIAGPWIVGVDYGTVNPFSAILFGLGADGVMYAVSEWRWDSKARQRQCTDAEYSQQLQKWLAGVRIPQSRLHGVEPAYVIVDPSAASFRLQLYEDGIQSLEGDNSVLDGIRTVATLLGSGKLKVHRSVTGLISEIPGYVWDERKVMLGEDAPLKVADHSCDAARYGLHTSRWVWAPRMGLAVA